MQCIARHIAYLPRAGLNIMSSSLTSSQLSEIVEMALSDHISFNQISAQHGVTPDEIKAIMRTQLKPGSYRAWRKRVRDFGDRREHYK